MKNYYNFYKLNYDSESINYYNSMTDIELNEELNLEFDDIEYYLNYYVEFAKPLFNGSDYDEHYYTFKSLLECLNNIKIILNIMKNRDCDE